MYSKLFSTRPNTAVLLFFAPLHLPFVPSLFFRVNFTLNEIPLGLLAVQQRDVNYDLCSLYFFFSFLFSFSLSLCVRLSVSISFVFALVEKYVCQQELFHRVHSALALLCTRSWSLTQLTLFCHVLCGISFEFVSDSDLPDCISIWNSRKFSRISDQREQRHGNNISGLFALEMRKFEIFIRGNIFFLFVLYFESNFSAREFSEGISMKFVKKKKKNSRKYLNRCEQSIVTRSVYLHRRWECIKFFWTKFYCFQFYGILTIFIKRARNFWEI